MPACGLSLAAAWLSSDRSCCDCGSLDPGRGTDGGGGVSRRPSPIFLAAQRRLGGSGPVPKHSPLRRWGGGPEGLVCREQGPPRPRISGTGDRQVCRTPSGGLASQGGHSHPPSHTHPEQGSDPVRFKGGGKATCPNSYPDKDPSLWVPRQEPSRASGGSGGEGALVLGGWRSHSQMSPA